MHSRRTSALHAQRWSEPDTPYFITCCTRFRASGLTSARIAGAVHGSVAASDANGDTTTYAFTIMPDHVHWLFVLGHRLSLGRLIARTKSECNGPLASAGLAWQRDFYEHQLRPEEPIEAYGLYVFLNPYRAGLISAQQIWAHWWCPDPERLPFMSLLNSDGTIPPEWIGNPIPESLAIGE